MAKSFDDLELKENLLRGIYAYGFEIPSSIQSKAVPKIMSGVDLIAQSQSGTGKTGAFSIGSLQQIDEDKNIIQCIIISHTRELAIQIDNVIQSLSKYMNINTELCIGGSSVKKNISNIDSIKPHILVCTPGRLLDILDRHVIDSTNLKLLVMDEADEILSLGFKEQIYNIMKYIKPEAQICIFSATYNEKVMELTSKFMTEPEKILVKTAELTLEGIKQYYIYLEKKEWKYDTLCDLYDSIIASQTIIYSNYKKEVDRIKDFLENKNFAVSSIHSNVTNDDRKIIMNKFRNGDIRILLSTNLLARGIDVQNVSIVVNFDLPFDNETYIHRIGRSGRFGRKGIAINFVTDNDVNRLKELEQFYNTQIEELPEDFRGVI